MILQTKKLKRMKRLLIFLIPFLFSLQSGAEAPYPVKGLCIAAPSPNGVDVFADFIDNELAPSGLNLLILRVDYNFEYESRPELRGDNPLTKRDVKKLV